MTPKLNLTGALEPDDSDVDAAGTVADAGAPGFAKDIGCDVGTLDVSIVADGAGALLNAPIRARSEGPVDEVCAGRGGLSSDCFAGAPKPNGFATDWDDVLDVV